MQAIANDVYSKNPNKKTLYITAEEFTNEVVEAIRNNATSMMKKKFRNLDMLLIDDLQCLVGKEKVQEELFHTFNILVDNSAQVVLSSDRHVSELKGVEKSIVTRISEGITVDIESPNFELRTAILLIKARKLGIVLPIDGAKTIAQDIKDTRALEGALLRIITQAEALGEDLTVELIKKPVENKSKNPLPFAPAEIIKNIFSFYNIIPSQIKSAKIDAFL